MPRAELDQQPSLHKAGAGRVQSHALTVLVVDDETPMLGFLTRFLEARTYNVRTATTVDGAIRVLQQATVDAVLLDVRMPGRSGLELLDYLRTEEELRDMPVIILTGAVLTPDEEATIARRRAYVFYKSENHESLGLYLDHLTGRA